MKLLRASGEPISPDHQKAQTEAMTAEMEKLEIKLGKPNEDNMVKYQKSLHKVHKKLIKIYPFTIDIDYPTESAMEVMCEQYGSVAFCLEDGKLTAYVLDQ